MKTDIQKSLYNIGKIGYLLTILFGENREIKKVTKEILNKNKEVKQIEILGDFIITIGKKSVILTKYQNGRREPIIVKPWVRGEPFFEGNKKTVPYVDVESYNWFHVFDHVGEFITFFKEREKEDDNLIFYHLELR